MEALNQVDICFVVDTTGSMSVFIAAAKRHLLAAAESLSADNRIDLQIGLVEFRDHPPQDKSFVTRSYALTSDLKRLQRDIQNLAANGGGDTPEAVYDGVHVACIGMNWRRHSARFVLLVGDAPPHGYRAQEWPDAQPARRAPNSSDGCQCGLTVQAVTAEAEEQRVTLHALCMNSHAQTVDAFRQLANATGGQCAPATNASDIVGEIAAVLAADFKNIGFDAQVLNAVERLHDLDTDRIATLLECPRLQAATALARLGRRDLLPHFAM